MARDIVNIFSIIFVNTCMRVVVACECLVSTDVKGRHHSSRNWSYGWLSAAIWMPETVQVLCDIGERS